MRALHQPPGEIIDDELFVLELRISGDGLLDDLPEQSVGLNQHVVFRGAGDLALAAAALALEGEAAGKLRHPARAALGDHFDRVLAAPTGIELGAPGAALPFQRRQLGKLSLDAHVGVFKVLAHDYEVDSLGRFERARKALRVADRPHVGVGLPAPSQIADPAGAAGGRAEQRGVG